MYDTAFHPGSLSEHSFLVTGGAGFIGSNLVEYLVRHEAGKIMVVDNLATGNLDNIRGFIEEGKIEFFETDINDFDKILELSSGIDYCLHQAALGSVPRSMKDPLSTHKANSTGFLSILDACRLNKVKKFVYASSSSVYGDSLELPKVEERTGNPKSPYAVTKVSNEQYASLYHKLYGMPVVGLRYFNIFGPKQNPKGPYAAAIPLFILEALNGGQPIVFGDGEQSRDFTFIENAVQGNMKAAFSSENANGQVFNIACGERYSLNEVLKQIEEITEVKLNIDYRDERPGDIRDSHAAIEKAKSILDYSPQVKLKEGLEKAVKWYRGNRE